MPSAAGQDLTATTENSLKQLVQRSWQIEDGLPQNTVSAIEQTGDGYIWLGTDEGLVRFNGVRMVVFDAGNTEVFASNQSIRALEERMDGSLWIGTDGGGLVWYKDGVFTSAVGQSESGPKQIIALYEDRAGTLWVGTYDDGLWVLRPGEQTAHQVFPKQTVRTLSEDSIGNVYAGTPSGIVRIRQTGEHEPFGSPYAKSSAIQNIFVDRFDRIWFATRDGVFRMDAPNSETTITKTPGLSFLQSANGLLWIGLDGGGILRIGTATESLTTDDGLTNDRIISLFEDREGTVWAGTEGGGVIQLYSGEFVSYGLREGLASEMILTVAASDDGSVWVGTENGGLYRFADGAFEHFDTESGLSDNFITSLATDNGTTWVGTYGGGLNRIDRRGIVHIGSEQGLPDGVVGAIEVGADGALWVGTDGGLSRLKDGDIQTWTTAEGLGSNYLTAIREAGDGKLWIGTYAGLYVLDEGTIHPASEQPDNTILSISEDTEGRLWVTTPHNGVFILENDEWLQFSRRNGLPSNSVYQVVADQMGRIWMSSNKGLFVGSREEILNAARTGETALLETKGRTEGLRSVEFNGGVQPAGTVDRDGRLWFPSIRGVVTALPEEPAVVAGPEVVIEAVDINGQASLTPFGSGSLTLSPDQKRLEISTAVMTFRSPERIDIEYLLENYDDDWSRAEAGQKITYTNVAPGNYTLRLRSASAATGIGLGPETTLSIARTPYAYQRPVFWVVILSLASIAIVAAHRLRIQSITRSEEIRRHELENLVEQRTTELKQLNDSLAEQVRHQVQTLMSERIKFENKLIRARDRAMESDRLKSTILTTLGHEFRTPITSIIGFSEILGERHCDEADIEFITYIKTSASRLLDTVTSLMDLAELEARATRHEVVPVSTCMVAADAASKFESEAAAKGVVLSVVCPPEPIVARIDPRLLHKAVTAIVNNAVKYTEKGSVSVGIEMRDGHLAVVVTDTGIGISSEFRPHLFEAFTQESHGESRQFEGCGLGLTVAHRLVDIMGGRIEVDSMVGSGSRFTILVPIASEPSGAIEVESRDPMPAAERDPAPSHAATPGFESAGGKAVKR